MTTTQMCSMAILMKYLLKENKLTEFRVAYLVSYNIYFTIDIFYSITDY